MDGPTAAELTFNAGLKTFTTKFLNQRRRKKRRDDRKSFIRSECIDTLSNSRKRLDAFRQDRTNVECFELASCHSHYSSQLFRRSPASVTSITDHITAIRRNQMLA